MSNIKLNYAECVNNNNSTLLCIYLVFNPPYWHPIVVSLNKRKKKNTHIYELRVNIQLKDKMSNELFE